jgi:hypothetical protein
LYYLNENDYFQVAATIVGSNFSCPFLLLLLLLLLLLGVLRF